MDINDLERFFQKLKQELENSRAAENFRSEAVALLYEKYVKPKHVETIKKWPYRVRAEVVNRGDINSDDMRSDETEVTFSEVVYRLEKHVSDCNLYYSPYKNEPPRFDLKWEVVGTFKTESEARETVAKLTEGP